MPRPVTNLKPLPIIRDRAGNVFTVHDLPRWQEGKRWTVSQKQLLIDAVKNNLLTREQLFERYKISERELSCWEAEEVRQAVSSVPAAPPAPYAVPDEPAVFGALSVDFKRQLVKIGDEALLLPKRMYKMLELMAVHGGKIVSVDMFMDQLYPGRLVRPKRKIVHVYVLKLRERLSKLSHEDYIENFWGRGYMLRAPK